MQLRAALGGTKVEVLREAKNGAQLVFLSNVGDRKAWSVLKDSLRIL